MKIILVILLLILTIYSLNVTFLMPGSITDQGWNYQILKGIHIIQDSKNVTTNYVQNVTLQNCMNISSNLLNHGSDLIFYCDGSLEPCAKNVSALYPLKYFVTQNGGIIYPNLPNLASDYKKDVITGRYVTGVFCAKQKNVQNICFMAPKTYGSRIRWSNFILLGMSTILKNKSLNLYVGLTTNFDDYLSESKVVQYFANVTKCDIIIAHQDSTNPQKLANSANIYSIGWGSDMELFVGPNVLLSLQTDWSIVFGYFIDQVVTNNFTSQVFTETFQNGGIHFSEYSSLSSVSAAIKAEKYFSDILDGKVNPYCGNPVKELYGTDCAELGQLTLTPLPGVMVVYDGTE